MVFVSDSFVFVFLPVFLAVYTVVPTAFRNLTILAFSLVFYGWWRFDFLPLLVGISCWSWSTGLWISEATGASRRRGLIAAIVPPLCSLIYFKYANLLADSAANLGMPIQGWSPIPLPIGLSFFVFGAISYAVDVFRGTVAADRSLVGYSTYQAMFGHLVAGPIVRYQSVAERLQWRTLSSTEFVEGWRRFMIGFAQKVVIGDTLAPLVDAGYALPAPTSSDAILTTVAYTLHLYFDFSGYSSMAIGLGLMVGFRFPENFDNPYLSRSLAEFWRRWHISLSGWLRDYLYIPLGGNRAGRVRSNLNLLITMALGGLWHGASWTFMIWGLWHGTGLVAGRLWSAMRLPQLPLFLGHVMTSIFVMAGWILFRAPDWQAAGTMFGGVIGANGFWMSPGFTAALRPVEIITLGIGIALVYLPAVARLSPRASAVVDQPPFALAIALWLWSLWLIQSRTVIPFLYFQF